jgi:beta-galactosidase
VQNEFTDDNWQVVNLPHGMELLPLTASGGTNYQGPCWYRKYFQLDTTMDGKKIMLHFEGIMGKSKIWVNGKLLKENFGGYYPIHIDITDFIKNGEKNVIAVRADNSNDPSFPPGKPQEQLDFTYFGGIYRDAWLITHNEIYVTNSIAANKVAGGGVFVHYENLSEKFADVLVDLDIANEGKAKEGQLQIELKDRTGNTVAFRQTRISLPSKKSKKVSETFTVKNPNLWTPDAPHLYNLYVTIKDTKGKTLDAFRKKIGMRTIEMRGQDGLYLNGQRYTEKLIGGNRHQDFAHIGHALPNNLHYRDALKLRRIGMRVIRSAHFVQDPAFMDACDELGLFVVVAIPGWQFWNDAPVFKERMLMDVRNLIRLERNRPSVLLWEVIPNETDFTEEFALLTNEAAKEEYPFPGCYTAADAGRNNTNESYFDVLYADDIVVEYPNKSTFKREWGDFVDNWVDHNSVSRVAKQWGEEAQIRQALHYFIEEGTLKGEFTTWPSLTKVYSSSNSLVGATFWHSFDHQRGYHPDPFWGGIMDAYRQPKFSYYMFKSLLPTEGLEFVPNVEAEPFVYIAHLMSPFSPEDVVVFTNCEEVRLSMFGELVGLKKATDSLSPVPRVPVVFKDAFNYVDVRNNNPKSFGQLNQGYDKRSVMIAEGLIGGKVVTEHIKWPAGRKRRLILKVDDVDVKPIADGSDITAVVAYVADASGAVKRLSDEYVRFTVEGAGKLIGGQDNGINPQKMLWGEAVALVRSGLEPGRIKVKAELLVDGINQPESAEIEFNTAETSHSLLYSDVPVHNQPVDIIRNITNESEELQKLRKILRDVKKELNEYKLNEVGRQQKEYGQ